MPTSLTGAQILWECLVREGVTDVFGYPGGAILPAYDAMGQYPVRHVLVRHEQSAAHMADGYARASGRVGVAIATSGPGATNLVTGIATAMMDSSPILCITGQVPRGLIGTDAFQETDITGITLPITKHNYLVTHAADLAPALREALAVARSGRPGPVLVDITKDAQQERALLDWDAAAPDADPGRGAVAPADDAAALALIEAAERPVILAGHGIVQAGATGALRAFAERLQAPVALTLLGLGGFPPSHPLHLGMMGMHGEAWVNTAIQEADLLVALGMRFDDRVTGRLDAYARGARKIHVDLDPAELNKNVPVDVAIAGDLRAALDRWTGQVRPRARPAWLARIAAGRAEALERDVLSGAPDGDGVDPARLMHDLWRLTGGGALVVTDVGQHQMWEAQYYRHAAPRSLITSGGLGTMGFALPAAIGAALARPDAEVWVVAGDGGFQMTMPELATLVQERLRLRIAVVNNGCLGMVRQWQDRFYGGRRAATPMSGPDFVKLAGAFGIEAARVSRHADVAAAVAAARASPGPSLIDFRVVPDADVYPMVPAGAALDEMIRRPARLAEAAG